MNARDREISFNIRHRIGVINSYQSGWKKEVNLVEWNDGPAKVDIRDWDPSHTHMGKGITLFPEEADRLQWLLYRYFRGNGASTLKGKDDPNLIPVPPEESGAYEAAVLETVLPEIDAETGEILSAETGEILETGTLEPELLETEINPDAYL